MNRDQALALLHEYTLTDSLRRHALAVASSMEWYADHFGEDKDLWWVTGLLHDFDYEKYPEPDPAAKSGHPYEGCKILKELGVEGSVIDAIMGHALYTETPRETRLAKTLFAVDELSGFVTACVFVRPDKSIFSLEPRSVIKKFKDKAFARGCNREEMVLGAQELGIEMNLHVENIIAALKAKADELGLRGVLQNQ